VAGQSAQKRRAPKNSFFVLNQMHRPAQPFAQKYSYFLFSELMITFTPSRLDKRGASRSSRTLRRDAVGVSMLQRGFTRADERR
jgi:hypothetical protein